MSLSPIVFIVSKYKKIQWSSKLSQLTLNSNFRHKLKLKFYSQLSGLSQAIQNFEARKTSMYDSFIKTEIFFSTVQALHLFWRDRAIKIIGNSSEWSMFSCSVSCWVASVCCQKQMSLTRDSHRFNLEVVRAITCAQMYADFFMEENISFETYQSKFLYFPSTATTLDYSHV